MKKNILNTLRFSVIPISIVIATLITPQVILANSLDKVKTFSKGFPLELKHLPPGRATDRLNQLPPAAQQKALKWLQKFSFPAEDLKSIHFDDDGGVLYVESHEINTTDVVQTSITLEVSSILPADTFNLHSKAGASSVVFLDFDGHAITGTAWNSVDIPTYNAKPFDIDGSPSSFNDDELARIQEIWHRVSEDFAPFDIDVTTEEPVIFTSKTGRILVTHSVDENSIPMPYNGGGGVAYVGVFGNSAYVDYYSPALVYYDHLGSGGPTYVAEASSHEFGHNLGLSHDGRSDPVESYYGGHGTGYVSWAPIMGVGYYTNVTQWSNGNYDYSNNTDQDDISIIASRLNFSADDHGDSIGTATPLHVEEDGSILVTNPQTEDYASPSTNNKGIIGSGSDLDYFMFYAEAGALDISVTPAWSAFYRSSLRGANLDVSLKLYNQAGSVVASSDTLDNTDATLSEIITVGGIYYIEISGIGNTVTPYNDYGSQGNYYISGSVAPAVVLDPPLAPSSALATAISYDKIDISWVDNATNESGYKVERSLDSNSWVQVATLLADTTSYSDIGLSGSTEYFYRAVAFNSGGETYSNTTSATTKPQLIMAPIYFLLQ